MIYLIDRRFRINNALNILVNQCKYPRIYNECFCLGCSKDLRSSFANNNNVNDGVNDNDNVNDLRSSFANNVNDNDNDLRSSFTNNDKDNDSVKDNVNDKDNDLQSSFTNNDNDNDNVNDNDNANDNVNDKDNDNVNENDNFIFLFDEKHQRDKPNNKECLSNNISVNINEDLQSWLNDDNLITEATLAENFRCIISGPSECGKTFLFQLTTD